MLFSVSTFIGIMSFVSFLIGIFTKEVVGLEMAILCQLTYLSLFFFQGTLELPFFALKGLVYSTGYNLPLADLKFQTLDQNPPQSFTLDFNPRSFTENFNLMIELYILPLIAVIPLILISMINLFRLGHKWITFFLGEIMFFCVMFNFQYLLFGMITFYQDGRDVKNYESLMLIWFGFTCTVMSIIGLIFKPEFYQNLRMVFKYKEKILAKKIS